MRDDGSRYLNAYVNVIARFRRGLWAPPEALCGVSSCIMTWNPVRTRWRRLTPPALVPVASVVGLVFLAGCGTTLLGSTTSTGVASSSTTSGAPSTTVPVDGEVAVAFPVVACTDSSYGGAAVKSRSGWDPTILLAPIPTSLVGKVTFYSDGVHTLLGPTGWDCAQVTPGPASGSGGTVAYPQTPTNGETATTVASTTPTTGQDAAIDAPGATTLVVYPPDDPTPPTSGPPPPGTEGVFATFATTGGDAGVDLVCPFFTLPSWQSQSAGCSTTKPFAETTDVLTPDVTEITDPAGVVGSLAASGGQGTTTGVVLFPQIPSAISYGSPIAVDMESCAIPTASLCPTVLSDFEVREFPVPTSG